MQLLAKFKKTLYVGFRATLNVVGGAMDSSVVHLSPDQAA